MREEKEAISYITPRAVHGFENARSVVRILLSLKVTVCNHTGVIKCVKMFRNVLKTSALYQIYKINKYLTIFFDNGHGILYGISSLTFENVRISSGFERLLDKKINRLISIVKTQKAYLK